MKSIGSGLFLAVLIGVLLLLLPEGLPVETLLSHRWRVSADGEQRGGKGGLAFSLDDYFGYVSEDGILQYSEAKPHRVSMHDDGYVVYGQVSELAVIFDAQGGVAGRIRQSGYPFYRGEALFLLSPGADSLYRLDLRGEVLWDYHGNVPITQVVSRAGLSILTTLTGDVINHEGVSLFSSSDVIAPVYSVALSKNAERLFLYRGGEAQSAVLYSLEEGLPGELAALTVDVGEASYQPSLFLDEKTLVFGRRDGLSLFRTNGKIFHSPREGLLLQLEQGARYFFSLHREGKRLFVRAWSYPLRLLSQIEVPDSTVFFRARGDNLYVGFGDELASLGLIDG